MFSVLYGASQLAGLVIIASSDNPFMKILGIAVEIVPLFMSIPLMKMSGTALNKIDGIFNRMTSPLTGAAAGFAASQGALAKQKALSKQNPVAPHTRLAQYLDKRRARRESDTAYLNALRNENNERYAEETMYSGKGDKKYLNRRGRARYQNEQRRLDNANAHKEWLADLDEGFGNEDRRIRNRDRAWVKRVNSDYISSIDRDSILKARQSKITLDNERARADRLHSALAEHANPHTLTDEDRRIRQEVSKAFRMDDNGAFFAALDKDRSNMRKKKEDRVALTAAETKSLRDHKQKLNVVLADSISARRKADAIDKSSYLELYDDSPSGPSNEHNLVSAIDTDNYNSMSAAIEIMAKRGDYADIGRVLRENSKKLVGDKHLYTQKVLNDTLIKMKADDPYLWAYAKNNMIRRSIHTSKGTLEGFIDYDTFLTNKMQAGDTEGDFDKVSFKSILNGLKDGKLFATADRTAFKDILEAIQDGTVPIDEKGHPDILVEPVKFARSSLCSGAMDGEALESYDNLFTLGYRAKNKAEHEKFMNKKDDKGNVDKKTAAFLKYQGQVEANLVEFFRDMSVSQLATTKTATLIQFNNAMNAMDNWDESAYEVHVVDGTEYYLNKRVKDLLVDKISDLNRNNMAGTRSSMNPVVRKLLGINGKLES